MTVQDLEKHNLILFECISGSRAYGLETVNSDTDIKGVFLLPRNYFYGFNYIPQVNNDTNDVVYYELGRFLELLSKNNPTALEMLYSAEDMILKKHPVMDLIDKNQILSKLSLQTFGNFALSQIKKAKGLNKKMNNPFPKEKKNILHFCYITVSGQTTPIFEFLKKQQLKQENCGLVALKNMKDLYALYYNEFGHFSGIYRGEDSTDVCLSSIPKNSNLIGYLYFNKDGYSYYCREYKEYWEWSKNKNKERFLANSSKGNSYDAKNMMHVFRLLEMSIEIGKNNSLNIRRLNRAELLRIKDGYYHYEELELKMNTLKDELERVKEESTLPDEPNLSYLNDLLVEMRVLLYDS